MNERSSIVRFVHKTWVAVVKAAFTCAVLLNTSVVTATGGADGLNRPLGLSGEPGNDPTFARWQIKLHGKAARRNRGAALSAFDTVNNITGMLSEHSGMAMLFQLSNGLRFHAGCQLANANIGAWNLHIDHYQAGKKESVRDRKHSQAVAQMEFPARVQEGREAIALLQTTRVVHDVMSAGRALAFDASRKGGMLTVFEARIQEDASLVTAIFSLIDEYPKALGTYMLDTHVSIAPLQKGMLEQLGSAVKRSARGDPFIIDVNDSAGDPLDDEKMFAEKRELCAQLVTLGTKTNLKPGLYYNGVRIRNSGIGQEAHFTAILENGTAEERARVFRQIYDQANPRQSFDEWIRLTLTRLGKAFYRAHLSTSESEFIYFDAESGGVVVNWIYFDPAVS